MLRENSSKGWDCYKVISRDGGLTWGPPSQLPIPACHRPTAGWLKDGRVMITCRLMQGGKGWVGWWTQNTLAVLTDRESLSFSARCSTLCANASSALAPHWSQRTAKFSPTLDEVFVGQHLLAHRVEIFRHRH